MAMTETMSTSGELKSKSSKEKSEIEVRPTSWRSSLVKPSKRTKPAEAERAQLVAHFEERLGNERELGNKDMSDLKPRYFEILKALSIS